MGIELIILLTLASSVLAYLTGKLHSILGSVVTIVASGFAFVAITYYGYNNELLFDVEWIPGVTFGSSYVGLFFAIIVSFVFFMVSFFNPYFVNKYKYKALYSMMYLLSLAGAIGVFFTSDFLNLFFFFELVVWSSMFLIPLGRSKSAAALYYGFSAAGSFALLFAIFVMRNVTGSFSMDAAFGATYTSTQSIIIFSMFMISAFAKLGAFPLHIWLPKVLGDAPDAITAVFSGGLEKLGAFVAVLGILKFAPVGFSIDVINMQFGNLVIAGLGALTIVFGTLMAIRQDDAKRLLAYSSMSNGGYILVALTLMDKASVGGGLYHVLAHALASTAAFLAIAAVSRQTGTTKMSELGGHIHEMPITYLVYLIAIISMAGIPPMGGFISKWLIFQSVINRGLILIGIATFFGSIGSFLYVFRPLAALFLGQQLPQYKNTVKEAPVLMLIPMLILSGLNIYTGVLPNFILGFINRVMSELNIVTLSLGTTTIDGYNGVLDPALISGVFGIGVLVAFIIFIVLKKSKKVGLMNTYTAGNFIYTEELLHYSVDFYAPLERLYEKYINIMKNFYINLGNKVREFGAMMKYFFFTYKPEITVFWIMIVIVFLLWGEL